MNALTLNLGWKESNQLYSTSMRMILKNKIWKDLK